MEAFCEEACVLLKDYAYEWKYYGASKLIYKDLIYINKHRHDRK